jgi:hypothetical protein
LNDLNRLNYLDYDELGTAKAARRNREDHARGGRK